MNIIRKYKFLRMEELKENKNPIKYPDVVIYTEVFSDDMMTSIADIDEKMNVYENIPEYLDFMTSYSDCYIRKNYNSCIINGLEYVNGMVVFLKKMQRL